ncbi:hypothetical protein R50073_24860 [Maricurvus nonylphenolicus]|uniref:hypothetical protein n=1 Tax=Maricurvus nonylphenolicus TaxID=1008307 RepID=UPI0036F43043
MKQQLLSYASDLAALLTNRPIALTLLTLLLYKIYSLAPETLLYSLAILLLSSLCAARWVLHYIAQKHIEYAETYQAIKRDKPQ